jgi:predicted Zn-dependent protease
VLKLKSDDCRVWFLLGEVTVNKSVDEAKNYYKKALELGSPCGYTLEKYALISSQTDKPLEAQFFILNAIKKYPEKPLLKATLAITEYRIGDKTQARKTIAEVYATSKDSTIEQIYKRIMK